MKNLKLLLLSSILLAGFSLCAQSVDLVRYVFSSGGQSGTSGDIYLSWTVGQSGLVGTFTQDDVVLIAGFQHSNMQVGIEELFCDPSSLNVYPNPFHENFSLLLDLEIYGELSYYLYDNSGKKVLEKLCLPLNGNPVEETVALTGVPNGIYNLVLFVFSNDGSAEKVSIKLIKQ